MDIRPPFVSRDAMAAITTHQRPWTDTALTRLLGRRDALSHEDYDLKRFAGRPHRSLIPELL